MGEPDPVALSFQTSKTTKISEHEPTIRAEDDPPILVGSYVGMTYTDKIISGMRRYAKRSQFRFFSVSPLIVAN